MGEVACGALRAGWSGTIFSAPRDSGILVRFFPRRDDGRHRSQLVIPSEMPLLFISSEVSAQPKDFDLPRTTSLTRLLVVSFNPIGGCFLTAQARISELLFQPMKRTYTMETASDRVTTALKFSEKPLKWILPARDVKQSS